MTPKLFSIFLGALFFFSCSNMEEDSLNSKSAAARSDSLFQQLTQSISNDSPPSNQSAHSKIKITDITSVKVLSAKKEFDSTSKFLKKYKDKCDSWALTKNDIEKILRTSTPIDGHEFHYYYDVLPCSYNGEAEIDGKLVGFKVNAGASTVLLLKDSSIYLGYKKNDFKKYFLLGPGID